MTCASTDSGFARVRTSARFRQYQSDWKSVLQVMYDNRLAHQSATYYTVEQLSDLLNASGITLSHSLQDTLSSGTKQGVFLQKNQFENGQFQYSRWAYNTNMRCVNPMNQALCGIQMSVTSCTSNSCCVGSFSLRGTNSGGQGFNDSPVALCPFQANGTGNSCSSNA